MKSVDNEVRKINKNPRSNNRLLFKINNCYDDEFINDKNLILKKNEQILQEQINSEKMKSLNQFKNDWGCCLANFEHIAVDPIELKDCYGNACSVCYDNLKEKSSFCFKCGNEHEIIFKSKNTSKIKNMKSNMQVIEFTREKLKSLCKSIEKERLETDCEKLLQSIRDKIEKRSNYLIHIFMRDKQFLEKKFRRIQRKDSTV